MTSAKLWCGLWDFPATFLLGQTNIVMNIHFHIRKHWLCGLSPASLSIPGMSGGNEIGILQIKKCLNLSTLMPDRQTDIGNINTKQRDRIKLLNPGPARYSGYLSQSMRAGRLSVPRPLVLRVRSWYSGDLNLVVPDLHTRWRQNYRNPHLFHHVLKPNIILDLWAKYNYTTLKGQREIGKNLVVRIFSRLTRNGVFMANNSWNTFNFYMWELGTSQEEAKKVELKVI